MEHSQDARAMGDAAKELEGQAEERLRESQRTLLEAERVAHVGHWKWDVVRNEVHWSEEMNRMWGLDSTEDRGNLTEKIALRVHPEDRARVAAMSQSALRSDAIAPLEFRIVHTDGTERSILAVPGDARRDANGRAVQLSGIVLDVTELRRATNEQMSLQAQLARAQHMDMIGRLAGGVAHDFNNALHVILGNVELALLQAEPAQPVFEQLRDIQQAAMRAAGLVQQLLAVAREQIAAPESTDLNAVVRGLRTVLQSLVGENIRLELVPAADLWTITMDPQHLTSILTALCIRARAAIPGAGTIVIETANATVDAAACAANADAVPGSYARLRVRDTGRGMDASTLAGLFEPGYVSWGAGPGSGLGLAPLYGAIRQNHGFLTVTSDAQQGTTFDIFWPRRGAGNAAAPPAAADIAPSGSGETILLVEDEPAILRVATRLLQARGYTVLSAGTPREAIALAQEHRGEIHLLLSDVVLPEMSGRELATALTQLRPRLRQLFMSGHSAGVIEDRGLLEPGVSLIEKPFSTVALATKVREVLDRA